MLDRAVIVRRAEGGYTMKIFPTLPTVSDFFEFVWPLLASQPDGARLQTDGADPAEDS
jgi:hypothetical protein